MRLRTIVIEENSADLQVNQTLGEALGVAKKVYEDVTVRFHDGFVMEVTPTDTKLLESWNSLHRIWSEMQKGAKESIKTEMETGTHFVKSDSEIKSDILVPHGPDYSLSAKEAKAIACEVIGKRAIETISNEIRRVANEGEFGIQFEGGLRPSIVEHFFLLGYKVEVDLSGRGKVQISWK